SEIINIVIKATKDIVYNEKINYPFGYEFLVGRILKEGGVCRHMALLVAALLEMLIDKGFLNGNVYYVRGEGHGWVVYETSSGDGVVIDPAQNRFERMDLVENYYNGFKPDAKYAKAYEKIKADEKAFLDNAKKGRSDSAMNS
ncbi:MAG: hypothetical protein HQL15_10040, partial [Candidatus Omnitrophica bacterium]|nr:hypothetical protein [Candidatus Omnitrophota bacterium]